MSQPVRIPADVDREDTVLANLTARQLLILGVTGLVLYGAWSITRTFVPLLVFMIPAIFVSATATFLAVGKRDGMPLDRLMLAAVRQRTAPRYRVSAPEGIQPAPTWLTRQVTPDEGQQAAGPVSPSALRLPAERITKTGVVDLGSHGVAAVAVCSTVNFALRTVTEQQSLVTTFGRYLHSLTAPVQILIRTERLDLSAQIAELRERAPSLHPALEAAAHDHADYLAHLAQTTDLLRRQVLLVLREPLRATPPLTCSTAPHSWPPHSPVTSRPTIRARPTTQPGVRPRRALRVDWVRRSNFWDAASLPSSSTRRRRAR